MYKCVFHPRTLLVTDKTIAFFVGAGSLTPLLPCPNTNKTGVNLTARYRALRYILSVCLLYPIRPLFLTAWTASVIFSTGRVRAKRT